MGLRSMTGLWVLVIVIGQLTFIGNDLYDSQVDCERVKTSLEEGISAAECSSLDALLGPQDKTDENGEDTPENDGPPGPHGDSDG